MTEPKIKSPINDPRDRNPRGVFERVAAEGADLERLRREYAGVTPTAGLPTVFSSGDGKTHLRGIDTQIVTPDGKQVAAFGQQHVFTCGSCKYFDLEKGRQEIVRQRFGEKLVYDYEWGVRHLGGDVDSVGLCGASGGEMATLFVSRACDQYRPRGV